ncbi:MAG: glutathione S-transferase C-terminal domain-containing protein [Steroidobacteraceae bacterium]
MSLTWLEEQLTPRASGSTFSLADCSAAPALFYADWVHPVGDRFPGVFAYRGRVLARPSVARRDRRHLGRSATLAADRP